MLRSICSDDTRPVKRCRTEEQKIDTFFNLPSDILNYIFSFTSKPLGYKFLNKNFYAICGNTFFWQLFVEKIGLTYTTYPQPTSTDVNPRLSKFKHDSHYNNPNYTIDPQKSCRENALKLLDNCPYNKIKFKLFEKKFSKGSISQYENELAFLMADLKGEKELSEIRSKLAKLFLNEECRTYRYGKKGKVQVDLKLNTSHFFHKILKKHHPENHKYIKLCIHFMDPTSIEAANFVSYRIFFESEIAELTATQTLYLGKALYYLKDRTEGQLQEASKHFDAVINSEKASKQEKRHASFYSLMARFESHTDSSTDEKLIQDLLFLLDDKKLALAHRELIHLRLAITRAEGSTEAINDEMALNYLKEIIRRNPFSTSKHNIVEKYLAYLAIRCNDKFQNFILRSKDKEILNLDDDWMKKFIISVHTLTNKSAYISYKDAKRNLKNLIATKTLNEQDKKIAEDALKQYPLVTTELTKVECIYENFKKMGLDFLKFIPDSFYEDESFLFRLTDINLNVLYFLKLNKNKVNNDFILKLMHCTQKILEGNEIKSYNFNLYASSSYYFFRYVTSNFKENEIFINSIKKIFFTLLQKEHLTRNNLHTLAYNYTFHFPITPGPYNFQFENKDFIEKLWKYRIKNNASIIPNEYFSDLEFITRLTLKNPNNFSLDDPRLPADKVYLQALGEKNYDYAMNPLKTKSSKFYYYRLITASQVAKKLDTLHNISQLLQICYEAKEYNLRNQSDTSAENMLTMIYSCYNQVTTYLKTNEVNNEFDSMLSLIDIYPDIFEVTGEKLKNNRDFLTLVAIKYPELQIHETESTEEESFEYL